MKKIQAVNGTVIIRLKYVMQDRTESGIYKDISYDKHGKMMISAIVQEVSDAGNNHIMFEVDRGAPRSKNIDPVYVYNKDVKHDIQIDDIIYFHYLTLEALQNFLFIEGEWKYYKVLISDIFLSLRPDKDGKYIRKGDSYKVHLHNEYAIGTPYWGEGWEPIDIDGRSAAGKIDPNSGIVTELKGKPQENRVVITDIGRGIKPYSRIKEVTSGDVCVLKPSCEFVNEIEGEERWVFTHSDILAKMVHGIMVPVGDIVLIHLRERTYEGKIEVDIDKLPLLDEGIVVSCGEGTESDLFTEGTEVKFFSHRSSVVMEDTHVLVRECNIMGILSYSI